MRSLLYPLIASALITITPFLATFEKGQDIVRGLFSYETFALLLFIIFVKDKIQGHAQSSSQKQSRPFFTLYLILLALLICALFAIAWIDLQNILAIKNRNTSWYGLLPFATCSLAIAMVWQIKSFHLRAISFILFTTLIIHLAAQNQYAAQPLAQFTTIDYLERIAPKPAQRKNITEEFKNKYTVTDSVSITRNYIDTTRNNVVILVESWGIPLEINRFEKQLKFFNGLKITSGIHNRMYSRTRTAEREDLIYEIHRDTAMHRDTAFIPQHLARTNIETTYLFGGNIQEHQRTKYIYNIGFKNVFFGDSLNDVIIANKLDSILTDSTQKHFIAWTTRDTKFPLEGFTSIYQSDADAVDSAYTQYLAQTLDLITHLARKHPDTRFIVQGDHNPILSPIKFQERFYKRWVPFVILN
jgi:hypothetical protein